MGVIANTTPIAVEVVNNPNWGQAFFIALAACALASLASGAVFRRSRISDHDRDLIKQIEATLCNILLLREALESRPEYATKKHDAFMQLRTDAFRLRCRSNRQFKRHVLDFADEGPGMNCMTEKVNVLRAEAEKLVAEELPPSKDS